ncbi:MAG: hypothetical protein ACR2RV_07080, partial [Verrucomicrobiales bacterium]
MSRRRNRTSDSSQKGSLKDLAWLFRYLLPYKRYFFPALIALFVTATLALAFPYYMGKLIGGATGMQVLQGGQTLDAEKVAAEINPIALTLLAVLALQA